VSGGKWSDVTEIVITGLSAEPLSASRDLLSFFGGWLSWPQSNGFLSSAAPGSGSNVSVSAWRYQL
jgi:hypothetical protein